MNLFKKSLLVWFLFIPIPIINGLVRNYTYKPHIGDLAAHQVSTFVLIFLYLLFIYLFFNKLLSKITYNKALLIGILWVLLTVGFEFIFGYFIAKNSIDKLIYDYNILNGRIWGVFLLFQFLSIVILKAIKLKTTQIE